MPIISGIGYALAATGGGALIIKVVTDIAEIVSK